MSWVSADDNLRNYGVSAAVAKTLEDPESPASVALRAALLPVWTASETVAANVYRLSPDGAIIKRTASGTTRATWDATEQAAWTVVAGGGGGGNITAGTTAGQIPVWDGDSYEPVTPAAVTAADIAFTPTGTVAAATVQAAIAEVASEAIPTSQKGANSGVATLDSAGQVPASQLGNASGGGGGSGDTWLGFAASNLSPSTSNTIITAGRIWFARVTRGSKTGATKIGLQIAVSSGNIMVGVYSPTGTGISALPGALKGSSVVTVCPAAGYQEVTLQAATDIAAGDFLAFWCDNATASFAYIGNNAATHKAVACYNDAGTGITAMPAGPIAAGSINGFSRHYHLTGV